MGRITIHPDDLREDDSILGIEFELDSPGEGFDQRDVLVFLQSAESFLRHLYVHVCRGRDTLYINARVGYGGSREFLTHEEKVKIDSIIENVNHYITTIIRRDIHPQLEMQSIHVERDSNDDDDPPSSLPPSSPLLVENNVALAV